MFDPAPNDSERITNSVDFYQKLGDVTKQLEEGQEIYIRGNIGDTYLEGVFQGMTSGATCTSSPYIKIGTDVRSPAAFQWLLVEVREKSS